MSFGGGIYQILFNSLNCNFARYKWLRNTAVGEREIA
ncbi:hypothetical protein FHS42_002368 [Streptomyces zagrosensis]|uniref:Uncharacterized protein n=1 Tax=Streptomyces zagrosensis TaxID=1042984 RepID=A0A7W9Q818_9ACTN|nr:hypothetical protein [Streptomyces zagrosensis]